MLHDGSKHIGYVDLDSGLIYTPKMEISQQLTISGHTNKAHLRRRTAAKRAGVNRTKWAVDIEEAAVRRYEEETN